MTPPTLRELLAVATPGPWKARRRSEDDPGFVQAPEPTKPYGTEILGEDYFPHRSRKADVDYIARLDPATMGAVLSALELSERYLFNAPLDGALDAHAKIVATIALLNGTTEAK
jgi:hypothetical protein